MSQAEFPGERLRARREERGFSLEEVHHHTHIPVCYLQAIEDGNVRALPAHAYALGFLKSYCQFLELPDEPFVDRFRACTHLSLSARLCMAGAGARSNVGAARSAWMGELLAWGAICALLLLGWFTYSVVVRPLADSRTPVEASTEEALPPSLSEGAL